MTKTIKNSSKLASTKQKKDRESSDRLNKQDGRVRKKPAKAKKQKITTSSASVDGVEVHVAGSHVAKWKAISTQTFNFFTAIIDANINSLLENASARMREDTQRQLMALRKGLQYELAGVKGPEPTENYSTLKHDQMKINQELHECSEDITMVQDEADRLNELIDENKSELLRLQQKVTLMQNKLREFQNTDSSAKT